LVAFDVAVVVAVAVAVVVVAVVAVAVNIAAGRFPRIGFFYCHRGVIIRLPVI